jgi:hypothetical protein
MKRDYSRQSTLMDVDTPFLDEDDGIWEDVNEDSLEVQDLDTDSITHQPNTHQPDTHQSNTHQPDTHQSNTYTSTEYTSTDYISTEHTHQMKAHQLKTSLEYTHHLDTLRNRQHIKKQSSHHTYPSN